MHAALNGHHRVPRRPAPLLRLADWHPRLADWAASRFGQPLQWGHNDCAMLCLEAIDVQCGTAWAGVYRGRWDSPHRARRFARRVETLPQALAKIGLVEVAEAPRRGDLITIPADGWDCGYVCLGAAVLSAWINAGVALAHTPAQPEPGQRVWRMA